MKYIDSLPATFRKSIVPTLSPFFTYYPRVLDNKYLLTAAYRREFSMLEEGRCKTKFPTFYKWYTTLNVDQRRVDKVLIVEY